MSFTAIDPAAPCFPVSTRTWYVCSPSFCGTNVIILRLFRYPLSAGISTTGTALEATRLDQNENSNINIRRICCCTANDYPVLMPGSLFPVLSGIPRSPRSISWMLFCASVRKSWLLQTLLPPLSCGWESCTCTRAKIH